MGGEFDRRLQRLLGTGRLVEAGHMLEQVGRGPEALGLYQRARAWMDVGRVLFQQGRYADAGDALLKLLPPGWTADQPVPPDLHQAIYQAAMSYERAGRAPRAASLLRALGDRQRAADVLRRAGHHAEAEQMHRGRRAAPRTANDPVAVALALGHERRHKEALSTLLAVAPTDPGYPRAARVAVAVARAIGGVDFDFDHFITPWLSGRAGRHTPADLQPLYVLGQLYEANGLREAAAEAYSACARIDPSYGDAERKARSLRRLEGPDAHKLGRILEEDRRFHRGAKGLTGVPELPELPDLPDLPELSGEVPMPDVARTRAVPSKTVVTDGKPKERPRPDAFIEPTADLELPRGTVLLPRERTEPSADEPHETIVDTGGPRMRVDPASLTEGDLVADRYRVDKMLGKGGMGVVFRVTDTMLEEDVAMKLFTHDGEEAELERFKSEMRICRKLTHPNVVRTFEFGTWRGCYFLTMEVLEGQDLSNLVQDGKGPLPLEQGLALMVQACDGLQAAHKLGIAHRDIKPHNLFVLDGGRELKVMDFGIAKGEGKSATLTATGALVGSPAYLAPERLTGAEIDGVTSDIYSLGIVFYEVFTGELPFQAQNIPQLFMQHVSEPPPEPRRINPNVPPTLEQIILRCVAKDPTDRFPDCKALRRELHRAWSELM